MATMEMEIQDSSASDMAEVTLAEIPEYLKSSEFYSNLNIDEDCSISVPRNCFKRDISVKDPNELCELLHTMRFWGVASIPIPLITYLMDFGDAEDIKHETSEFVTVFPFLNTLQVLAVTVESNRMDTAISLGDLQVVTVLRELGHGWTLTSAELAAASGNVNLLSYLHTSDCDWNANTTLEAVRNGHHDCLMFAVDHGCPVMDELLEYAAISGSVDCLQFLHERGLPWNDDVPMLCAEHGRLDCMQYAHENGCLWDRSHLTVYTAVKHDHWPCAEYAYLGGARAHTAIYSCILQRRDWSQLIRAQELGMPWDSRATATAASEGLLDFLQYLHESGCPWTAGTCTSAAQHGHLDCLIYAHEHGCALGQDIALQAHTDDAIGQYLYAHGCSGMRLETPAGQAPTIVCDHTGQTWLAAVAPVDSTIAAVITLTDDDDAPADGADAVATTVPAPVPTAVASGAAHVAVAGANVVGAEHDGGCKCALS